VCGSPPVQHLPLNPLVVAVQAVPGTYLTNWYYAMQSRWLSARRRSALSASMVPGMVPVCVSRSRRLRSASTPSTSAASAESTQSSARLSASGTARPARRYAVPCSCGFASVCGVGGGGLVTAEDICFWPPGWHDRNGRRGGGVGFRGGGSRHESGRRGSKEC